MTPSLYVDSHLHLDDPRFDGEREQTIDRALQAGVGEFLCPLETTEVPPGRGELLALGETRPYLRFAYGVHPHQARLYDDAQEKSLLESLTKPGTVALGEIGLDFFYDLSERECQKRVFDRQLSLASEMNLPVIVHLRDCFPEAEEILFRHRGLRGVLHSYTGDGAFMKKAVDKGYFISFSGMLTFSKAKAIRETFSMVPPERLLLETDSPYLAPVPYRGKRNEPLFILSLYQKAAELLYREVESVRDLVYKNYLTLFPQAPTRP